MRSAPPFIMLLMVKDHHVHVYRNAATTDHLTGLLNRGAFMECAQAVRPSGQTRPAGDAADVRSRSFQIDQRPLWSRRRRQCAARVRAGGAQKHARERHHRQAGRRGIRGYRAGADGGGQASLPSACAPASRPPAPRSARHAIGATVSIGAATSYEPVTDIDALIARADAALYRAKHDGRNRIRTADDEPAPTQGARLIAAARSGQAPNAGVCCSAKRRPAPQIRRPRETTGRVQRLVYYIRANMRGCCV